MERRMLIIAIISIVIIISVSAALIITQPNHEDNRISYVIDADDVKLASEDTSNRYISPFTKKSETSRKNAELFISKAIADDDLDKDGISSLKNCLNALKSRCGDDLPGYALRYIQDNFDYRSDSELYNEREWAAYAVETLDKKAGDCEDLVILMTSLLHNAGYDCGIAVFSNITVDGKKLSGHAVVMTAVDVDTAIYDADTDEYKRFCIEQDGKRYYAFETTGDCPPGYTFKEYADSADTLKSSYKFLTISEYLMNDD